ncbi:MAG TPA: quinol:cytochrome C oxidoreductase [Spirochaetes bacterium]|nr:quinol:cytochrome C oxidoreductase [Spirochaetota bacterium]
MSETFDFTNRLKLICLILIAIGIVSLTFGYLEYAGPESYHQRFWANILVNNFLFLGVAVGATFFVALQYVANAGWSVAIKRIPEAMGAFIPIAAVLMLVFYFAGGKNLYHWIHELHKTVPDAIIAGKSSYLNEPFFIIRMIGFFAIWSFFWWFFRRSSMKEDQTGGLDSYKSSRRLGSIFMILFALTVSFASFDWLMSLDPHWFSTMFGVYGFSGIILHTIAIIAIIVVFLKRKGYLKGTNENHVHDLGRLMFGFSTFWIYIWYFQFMLIWYANIPEETAYFKHRVEGPWLGYFIANAVVNWAIPFFALMTRNSKRNLMNVTIIGIVLVFGYWLDLYVTVFPSAVGVIGETGMMPLPPSIGYLEIGGFLGYIGLFMLVLGRFLSKAPLMPKKHPLLEESLHLHT